MTYSEFTITFNEDLVQSERIVVRTGDLNDAIFGALSETWKLFRVNSYQVTVGTPTAIPGERSAINYMSAFNLDFNGTQIYEVTRDVNIVTVKAKFASIKFFQPTTPDPLLPSGPYPNIPSGADLSITNFSGDVFEITDVSFDTATENAACTHYKAVVTTSNLATILTLPGGVIVNDNTENPFSFEVQRGVGFVIYCYDADGQSDSVGVIAANAPQPMAGLEFNIIVTNSPNGATVSAINSQPIVNELEFSLDNSTWQESSVFTGLPSGNYTLHIRDAYGCSTSQNFVVDDNGVTKPFSYYSKINAIRMAERIAYGNCGPYKTDDTSLSCEEFALDPNLTGTYYQPFQTCDSPVNQLLSNYQNILVEIIKEDGNVDIIPTQQYTNNIGRKDARDSTRFFYNIGKTGVYFMSGNIYDYDTDADTGNDYALNGGLPEWAVVGNYFSIDNAWYEIENIVYSETLNAEVLIINAPFTLGTSSNAVVKAIYNRQPYEVHEFTIPMAPYLGQTVQVRTTETDSRFEDVVRLSEKIMVKELWEKTVEVISFHVNNTDILYNTGIQHKVRVPLHKCAGAIEDESEVNKGDDQSGLVTSNVHELEVFEFGPMSKGIYRQVSQLLSNKIVLIKGEAVAKNGSFEQEGPIDDTNLYLLKATMIRTNAKYLVGNTGGELITNVENIEVPNLVVTDADDFISYD